MYSNVFVTVSEQSQSLFSHLHIVLRALITQRGIQLWSTPQFHSFMTTCLNTSRMRGYIRTLSPKQWNTITEKILSVPQQKRKWITNGSYPVC